MTRPDTAEQPSGPQTEPPEAAVAETPAQDTDRNAWRATLLVTLGFLVLSLLWVFVLAQLTRLALLGGDFNPNYWFGGTDIWPPIRGAKIMLYGGVLAPYGFNPNLVAMPLHAAVHLPLAAIAILFDIPPPAVTANATLPFGPGQDAAGLTLARWPLAPIYAVWAVLWSIAFSKVVRTLAWELGARRRLWTLQAAALVLGFFPMVIIFGHLEDGLMVTLVLFAIVQCRRRNWTNVAICLALALSFKQTTALVVPMFFFFVPKGQRLRFSLITISLPLLLVVGVLVADFESAFRALFRPPTYPTVESGRVAWFLSTDAKVINAGPYRIGAPVLALVVAVWLRRNRNLALLTAGVGVAFFARLPFEAVTFMYYLSPVLVVAAIYERRRNGRAVFATVFGLPALALFWWDGSKEWWFWLIDAPLIALATWPLFVDVARRRFGGRDGDALEMPGCGVGGAPQATADTAADDEGRDPGTAPEDRTSAPSDGVIL